MGFAFNLLLCGGIDHFIAYVEHTWLGGQFTPAKWNVHSKEGPRTNNNLEGWHIKVKNIASKNHLNIFEIIELFKNRLQQKSKLVS